MTTVRRYPIPATSFDPDHPLNDLLQAQLQHFRFIESRLPPELRSTHSPAALDHAAASARYIADMTSRIHHRGGAVPAAATEAGPPTQAAPAKQASPMLVPKRRTDAKGVEKASASAKVDLAASATVKKEQVDSRGKPAKKGSNRKAKDGGR